MRYIWTSGRKCNFNGCNRPDLQPPNVNGWFWSGSGAKIGPTTQRNSGDWSHTGGFGQPQPDNREAPQVQKCHTGYWLTIELWEGEANSVPPSPASTHVVPVLALTTYSSVLMLMAIWDR